MLAGGAVTLTVLTIVLLIAAVVDVKWHKIPNLLSAFAVLYGLVAHFYVELSMMQPILGMAIGIIVFLPFYIGGGMGAGDVKFMGAIGTILGTKIILAAGMTLIAGSVIGLLVVLSSASGYSALMSFFRAFISYVRLGVWNMDKAQLDAHRRKRFPYSIAIGVGTLSSLIFTLSPGP